MAIWLWVLLAIFSPILAVIFRQLYVLSIYLIASRRLDPRIPRYPKFMGIVYTIGSVDKMEENWLTLQRPDGSYEPLLHLGPFESTPYVLVQDAECLKQILTSSDFVDFPKHELVYRLSASVVGNGIVHSSGDAWKLRRRLATPIFHFRALREHSKEMLSQAVQLVEKLSGMDPTQSVDVRKLLCNTTLTVIISMAFGNDFDVNWMAENELKLQKLFGPYATQVVLLGFLATDNLPFLGGKPLFAQKTKIEDKILQVIQERRKRLEHASADEQVDLLSLLILNRDENGVGLTDYEITQECLTFIFAGFDTSATTISWMLYYLAKNPHIQARLHQEIDSILSSKPTPSLEDVTRFPFLRDVMRETLRLAPPTSVLTREAKHDLKLGDHFIPKGTALGMSFFSVGRDPRYWDDPLVFKPERWSGLTSDDTNAPSSTSPARHPFAYVPFSAGLRNCLGQKFAQQEIILIVATLLKRFRVEVDETKPVKLTMEVVVVPGNFHARFIPRD